MTLFIIGYFIIGIIASFIYLVLIKYYDYREMFVTEFAPVLIVPLWPAAAPIVAIVMLAKAMSTISQSVADNLKNKR